MHHDSELGLVAVRRRDEDACWHWIMVAVLIGALSGTAMCIAIIEHNANPPSTTPLIEKHAP